MKPKESRSLIHQKNFKRLPFQSKIKQLEKEDFLTILKDFDNFDKEDQWFDYFCLLLRAFTNKDIWVKHLILVKKHVIHFTENYLSRIDSYNVLPGKIVELINITRDKRLLDILFPVYLEAFDHFPINRLMKFRAFNIFIHMSHMSHVISMRNTEILDKFILLIEAQFLKLLEEIDRLEKYDKTRALSWLLMVFQGGFNRGRFRRHVTPIEGYPKYLIPIWDKHSTLIKKKFLSIISNFSSFSVDKNFNSYFMNIMGMSIEIGLMNEHFTIYLDVIEKLDEVERMRNFFDLIFLVEDNDISKENAARIERISLSFLELYDPILHKFPIEEVEPFLSNLYKNFIKVTKLFRIVGLRTKYLHKLESIFSSLLFYISRFRYYTTAILSLWSAIPNLNVEEKYIQILLDTTNKFKFSLKVEITIFSRIMEISKYYSKIWEKRFFPQIKTMLISLLYRSYPNDDDYDDPTSEWYELLGILDRYPDLHDVYEEWYSSDKFGKEFKVNKFITLKLEGKKTNIYVNGELFEQCKYPMFNIPLKVSEKYENIESIDEAADLSGWTFHPSNFQKWIENPHTRSDFLGFCFKFKTWYEQNYDTRLLHSNLAFPLLKQLKDCGDSLAQKVFKEEITKRFESGYPSVVSYLRKEGYLNYLDKEQIIALLKKYIRKHEYLNSLDINTLLKNEKDFQVLRRAFGNLRELEKIRDLLAAMEGTPEAKPEA